MISITNNRNGPAKGPCLLAATLTALGAFGANSALAAPVQTTASLQVPTEGNGVPVAGEATITAQVTVINAQQQDIGASGGKLVIRKAVDKKGAPVSCGAASRAGDAAVAALDPVNVGQNTGTYSVNFNADMSAAGSFGYSALYVPDTRKYAPSQAACVDLVVEEQPCSSNGLSLTVNAADGMSPGYAGESYTASYVVALRNCGPGPETSVTVQAKAGSWNQFYGYVQQAGTTAVMQQTGGKNDTILWTIGDMPEGAAKKITVVVDGTIAAGTPSGTVLPLGAWSAKNVDGDTTDLSGPATVTVASKPK